MLTPGVRYDFLSGEEDVFGRILYAGEVGSSFVERDPNNDGWWEVDEACTSPQETVLGGWTREDGLFPVCKRGVDADFDDFEEMFSCVHETCPYYRRLVYRKRR
jgi:hypothetical protein